MARESSQHIAVTKEAEGAIAAYTMVQYNAKGKVEAVGTVGNAAAGIAVHAVKDGEDVDIVVQGRTKVVSNLAANEWELFGSSAAGKATTTVAAGNYVMGRFLDAPSAANEVVDCILHGPVATHSALT